MRLLLEEALLELLAVLELEALLELLAAVLELEALLELLAAVLLLEVLLELEGVAAVLLELGVLDELASLLLLCKEAISISQYVFFVISTLAKLVKQVFIMPLSMSSLPILPRMSSLAS